MCRVSPGRFETYAFQIPQFCQFVATNKVPSCILRLGQSSGVRFRTSPVSEYSSGCNRQGKSIHTRATRPMPLLDHFWGFQVVVGHCLSHHALSQLTHIDDLVYYVVLFFFVSHPCPTQDSREFFGCPTQDSRELLIVLHRTLVIFLIAFFSLPEDAGRPRQTKTRGTQSLDKTICQNISICTIFSTFSFGVDSKKVQVGLSFLLLVL